MGTVIDITSRLFITRSEKEREFHAKEYTRLALQIRERARLAACKKQRKQRTPPWADMEKIKEIYRQAQALTEQTGIRHDVDHIIPLKGKKVSGLHVESNLQILKHEENRRKSNSFHVE